MRPCVWSFLNAASETLLRLAPVCNIGTSRWELRVGPITAWLDRMAGAAWNEPGSIASCTLTSADPALLGIKDLVGNAQCQNVVCGNGTAETLGKIIIPLCNWLFIMWAIEQPVHVWVPMYDTIQRVHEKVHEIHGSRHALLAQLGWALGPPPSGVEAPRQLLPWWARH